MVGLKSDDLKIISFSSYDFLCALKFLFSKFADDLKQLLNYRSRASYRSQPR